LIQKYLALKASAGSGKTFALSIRYISLLFLDVNPTSILTLTFTNKAALEMSSRIYQTLLNLGNDKLVLDELQDKTTLTEDKLLEKKQDVLNRFINSELSIYTIDKFVNKILREFSGFIGVSDDFSIDNDDEDLLLYNFLSNLNEREFTLLKREVTGW